MDRTRKLDLALEARELAAEAGEVPGVRLEEETVRGLSLTRVQIETEQGARALSKPVGTYLTLDLPALPRYREEVLTTAEAVADLVRELIPATGPALAVGLGNRRMTPDALGPRTAEGMLVTRHLMDILPKAGLRPVSALSPGVTGTTGMESGELIAAAAGKLAPACVIAVDALAARRQERVCRTIQLSDGGIVPGSGVGNARMALDRKTLGVPVIAVGVPTVVEAATLCLDLLDGDFDPSVFRQEGAAWFVTPRNIDQEIEVLSRVLALGLSAGLQPNLSVEDVESWLA